MNTHADVEGMLVDFTSLIKVELIYTGHKGGKVALVSVTNHQDSRVCSKGQEEYGVRENTECVVKVGRITVEDDRLSLLQCQP